jgi:glutathione synthase/RimK-type ligase-like ATP-grasp enzyme
MERTPLLLRGQEYVRHVPPRSLDFNTRVIDIFGDRLVGVSASEPQLLMITRTTDAEADAVGVKLATRGVAYLRIDCDTLVDQVRMSLRLDPQVRHAPKLSLNSALLQLNNPLLIWFRNFDVSAISLPSENHKARLFARSEWSAAIHTLAVIKQATWINDPRTVHKMDRIAQLSLARDVSLRIPRTLVSNEPEDIHSFARSCGGEVVAKVIGEHFVPTAPDELHGIFPQILTQAQLFSAETLQSVPCLYQERIEIDKEIRVTVIGEGVIAAEVSKNNPAEIWERPEQVAVECHDLPEAVKRKLLKFMQLSGLQYGAFDLILTPDGEYVFLEVNPSGDWMWLEARNESLGITDLFVSYVMAIMEGKRS